MQIQVLSDFAPKVQAVEQTLEEWQLQAIREGIAAADRGEIFDFDNIKKHWELH